MVILFMSDGGVLVQGYSVHAIVKKCLYINQPILKGEELIRQDVYFSPFSLGGPLCLSSVAQRTALSGCQVEIRTWVFCPQKQAAFNNGFNLATPYPT